MVGIPKRPAGRSVQTTVVKNNSEEIERQLSNLKAELLAELAKMFGEVKAAQLLGYTAEASNQHDDTPVFIPNTIGTGENIEAEINIETKESDATGLDDAAAALREMKRKNKEDKNEQ